jgi:hypothetical protein
MQDEPSGNLRRRYGYLEKTFDACASGCLALNQHDRRISGAHSTLDREGNLHRTDEVHPLRVTANRPDTLRVRLMIAMILAYLAMMAFVIYSARHPAPATIASITFSPAMIALASCMAFSVILTGLFVFMRHGD